MSNRNKPKNYFEVPVRAFDPSFGPYGSRSVLTIRANTIAQARHKASNLRYQVIAGQIRPIQ